MRFRNLGFGLALSLSVATQSVATPGQDVVISALQDQGFEVRLVHWTLLGRIRIVAISADIRREIVINPNTGEILRDYSQRVEAEVSAVRDGNHDSSDGVATQPAGAFERIDLDASAVDALSNMDMVVAAPGLLDLGQE